MAKGRNAYEGKSKWGYENPSDNRADILRNSRFKFNPDKTGKTTKYYNQGFSGGFKKEFEYSKKTQEARLEKRADEYDAWKKIDNRVTKTAAKQGAGRNKIGAVSSSWITSLGYNAESNEAVATFKGSNAEFYYKMSYDTFLDWYTSPSKGKWLHDRPSIMHSYTIRSGRGSNSMQDRVNMFDDNFGLVERGNDKLLKEKTGMTRAENRARRYGYGNDGTGKVNKYLSKWRG